MYVGTIACVVSSLLYPWLAFVSGFLALRFFHGFSTAFKPTGTSAYVADVVSEENRGEAMVFWESPSAWEPVFHRFSEDG
jgi:MFS family permease